MQIPMSVVRYCSECGFISLPAALGSDGVHELCLDPWAKSIALPPPFDFFVFVLLAGWDPPHNRERILLADVHALLSWEGVLIDSFE